MEGEARPDVGAPPSARWPRVPRAPEVVEVMEPGEREGPGGARRLVPVAVREGPGVLAPPEGPRPRVRPRAAGASAMSTLTMGAVVRPNP